MTLIDLLATTAARIEESSIPSATILPNFPRSIQLDGYSCGAKCVYCILKHFKKDVSAGLVQRQLKTNWEGTSRSDIKRVLKKYGLKVHILNHARFRDIRKAINEGSPVLISIHDHWHYSVVYGYADDLVFVMNPSLGEMGRQSCIVSREQFTREWDNWAIVVSERRSK